MNKKEILLAFLFCISIGLIAQQSQTTYYMDRVVQSTYLNPAKQYPCKFYIGMPIFSPLEINAFNSGATINDFIFDRGDSTTTFLHPMEYGVKGLLNNYKDITYMGLENSYSLASIGFKAGDLYVTLNIQDKMNTYLTIPKDMIRIPTEGLRNGSYDFSTLNMDIMHYREIGLGLSQDIDDEWTIGARIKALFGLSVIRTENDMNLNVNYEQYNVPSGGIKVNASIPADFYFSNEGKIDSVEIKEEMEEVDGLVDYYTNFENFGAALDIGAIYRPNDRFEISASVIDLGSIGWKTNVVSMTQSYDLNFRGVNISGSDSITDFDQQFDEAVNDITDSLRVNNTNSPFSTPLSAKIYLGARYFVGKKLSVGFLNKNVIYRSKLRPQFTFSANFNDKIISTAISYTIMNNSYNNFGIGLNFKLAPFNLYIITDNMPLSYDYYQFEQGGEKYIFPNNLKNINFRIGLNLIFGCKDPLRDKPMIY